MRQVLVRYLHMNGDARAFVDFPLLIYFPFCSDILKYFVSSCTSMPFLFAVDTFVCLLVCLFVFFCVFPSILSS